MSLLTVVHGRGTTAAKPAAAAANEGYLYQDTTLGRLERSNGATWDVIGATAGGVIATDTIWDAAGDLVQGTGADAGAKLTAGTAGNFLKSAGAAAANLWAFPPGHEFDYAQVTASASITATTAGTANTVITGNAVTYDGSTIVIVQFFSPFARPDTAAAGRDITIGIWEGATEIGRIGYLTTEAAATQFSVVNGEYRFTPTAAAHTYLIKAFVSAGTGSIGAGAAGAAGAPAFMRIRKV